MTSSHDSRHEAWLDTLLAGDEASLPRDARLAIESCEQCRADRARLESFAAELDAHGRADRVLLAESRAHEPNLEEFRRRALVAEAKHASIARPRRSLLLPLAAACVVLVAAYALFGRKHRADDGPLATNGKTIELTRPVATVASYAPFEWSGPLDPDGWFVVYVWKGTQDPDREPAWITQKTSDHAWSPERSDWPGSIYWRVRSYDSGRGLRLQSSLGSASSTQ